MDIVQSALKNLKIFLVCLFLTLASVNPSEGNFCTRYLHRNDPTFSYENFLKEKGEFKYRISRGDTLFDSGRPLSGESQLALLEIYSEGRGWDLFDFEKTLASSPELGRKISDLLRTYDLNQSLSSFQVDRFINLLYRASNPGAGSLSEVMKNGFDHETFALIRERAQISLATHEFSQALDELGLLRKNTSLEHFRSWRMRHPALENATLSMILNTIIYLKFGPFLSTPVLKLLRTKSLDAATLKSIKEEGFEAALPTLYKKWGLAAKVQIRSTVVNRIIFTGYAAFAGYYVLSNFSAIRSTVGSALTGKKRTKQQESEDTADEIRKRQFQSWQAGYEDITGSKLDTLNNATDRALAREQWEILKSIPESELRIQ